MSQSKTVYGTSQFYQHSVMNHGKENTGILCCRHSLIKCITAEDANIQYLVLHGVKIQNKGFLPQKILLRFKYMATESESR